MGLSTLVSKSKAPGHLTPARPDRLLVLSSVLVVSSCGISACSLNQVQPRRTFWGWGGRDGRDSPYDDRFWKRLEKLEQHYMSKQAKSLRRQALLSQKWGQRLSQEHPWWGGQWGWRRFQSGLNSRQTEGSGGHNSRKFGKDPGEQNSQEAEGTWFDRDMQRFKKAIEADPYKFLFGKSNEWLRYRDRSSRDWSSFCRSFLGYDEAPKKANDLETSVSSNKKHASSPNETIKNDKATESSDSQAESTVVSESSSNAAPDTSHTSLEFDPVSGRMMSKVSQSPEVAKDGMKNDDVVGIPVKTFKSYRTRFGYGMETNTTQENDSANLKGENEQPDQVQSKPPRDTGEPKPVQKPDVLYMSGPGKDIDPSPSSEVSVQADLEPSSSDVKDKTTTSPEAQRREYTFEEIKDDDVDLLRPSDIRTSFHSGKTKQEIIEEKKAKREALERDFSSYQDPEGELDAETIRARARDYQSSQVPETQAEVKSNVTPSLHDVETSTAQSSEQSRPSMISGSESGPSLKDQPRHGSISQQATSISGDNDLAQSRKSALPDQLVQEIKDIYESTYGEITPQHRQEGPAGRIAPSNADKSPSATNLQQQTLDTSFQETFQAAKEFTETANEVAKGLTETCERLETFKSALSSSPSASLPAIYRVLAYDSSSLQVVIAETTSSVYSADRTLHPAEVLSRLNNPAQFLPHFAQMQADGYEIVSGGGDILVFKKVREAGISSMTAAEPGENAVSAATKINSAESRLQEQQGISNEMERDQPSARPEESSSSASRMVRRQETVYSGGPPNWSPYPPPPPVEVNTETETISHEGESSFGRRTRWILLTGFATAATCYAVGVVCEYFRTGGEDGLGPEGFTEFESERRRRERTG
jgi:hypothetical protein